MENRKSGRTWPAAASGVFLLLYALLALAVIWACADEAPPGGVALGLLLQLPVPVLGILLLCCRPGMEGDFGVSPDDSGTGGPSQAFGPQAVLRERAFVPVLGIFCGLPGTAFFFVSLTLCMHPPLDLPFALFMALIGFLLLFTGVWALLAWKNRMLLLFQSGALTYVTSWGRRKEFLPGLTARIRFGANDTILFLDADGRTMLRVERNMRGMEGLDGWIEEQGIPGELTSFLERQVQRADGGAVLEWKEEYRTGWHDHLKAVRILLVLSVLLLALGSVAPFLLYVTGLLKFRPAVSLSAVSLLPFLGCCILFAPVLTMDAKPKGATEEWKAMHVRVPSLLVLLLILLLGGQFFYIWNRWILQTVDEGRFIVLWLILGGLLAALIFIRTPRRLRGEGLFLVCLVCLFCGYVLAYGGNLALCTSARHYPAEVVERDERQEEDGDDMEYYLTVRLDDGTMAELLVPESLYRMEAAGEEIVVCQRDSLFSIRMVDLHLPTEEK